MPMNFNSGTYHLLHPVIRPSVIHMHF
jgi:hypothetical protein